MIARSESEFAQNLSALFLTVRTAVGDLNRVGVLCRGYGGAGASERVLGNCIATGIERGLWERMDLVISTKLVHRD